jgi:hypothetical protein
MVGRRARQPSTTPAGPLMTSATRALTPQSTVSPRGAIKPEGAVCRTSYGDELTLPLTREKKRFAEKEKPRGHVGTRASEEGR